MSAYILGAVLAHRAAAAPVVTICVDTASPTAALDTRVSRAALRTQGALLRVVHFVGIGRGGDGFPIGKFARMASSDCELIMGFPVDVSNPQLPSDVHATQAYARTGFVLARLTSEPKLTLAELPQGTEVGIAQLDTYAGLLYPEHPNMVMHVYPDNAEMIADLRRHRIAGGLAWQPSLEALRRESTAPVRMEPLLERHMRWDLVALYLPAAQAQATLFEQGVQALRSQQKLSALIRPYQDAATAASRPAAVRVTTVPRSAMTRGALRGRSGVDAAFGVVRRVRLVRLQTACGSKRPPALYTEEQAKQGVVSYQQNCGMCHGPLLTGQKDGYPGPALKGAAFADPSYNFHVREIFNFIAKLMPPGTPGSLTHDQDVVIMAYILQQNGYPAGKHALTYEQAEKSKVPIRYYVK